ASLKLVIAPWTEIPVWASQIWHCDQTEGGGPISAVPLFSPGSQCEEALEGIATITRLGLSSLETDTFFDDRECYMLRIDFGNYWADGDASAGMGIANNDFHATVDNLCGSSEARFANSALRSPWQVFVAV